MAGHNVASFNANFLSAAGRRVEFPITNDFVETMCLSRKLYKGREHNRLQDPREHYGITDKGAHRALTDALATSQTFVSVCAETLGRKSEARRLRLVTELKATGMTLQQTSMKKWE